MDQTNSFRNKGKGKAKRPSVSVPLGLRGKQIGLFYRDLHRAKTAEDVLKVTEVYKLKANEAVNSGRSKIVTNEERMRRKEKRRKKSSIMGHIAIPERKQQHIRKILRHGSSDHVYVIDDSTYSSIEDSYFKRTFLNTIRGSIFDKILFSTSLIIQKPEMDEELYIEHLNKLRDVKFTTMLQKRKMLPAFDMRKQILSIIEANQVILISGETGCGKTTQVGQFILEDYIERKKGSICKIICTQPRRISAISVAERVAEERTEKLGDSVGYQIRLEKKLPRDTASICFCTTGVILKQMERNPALTGISHIIIDEVHERSVTSDFLMAVLQEVIRKRKDIKIILMSATLNSEAFSKYYGNCPHLNIPGFTFPVKQYFLEDVLRKIKFSFSSGPSPSKVWKMNRNQMEISDFEEKVIPYVNDLFRSKQYNVEICKKLKNPLSECLNIDLIFALVKYICDKKDDDNGSILIFLPGYANISDLHKMLEKSPLFPSHKFVLIPLHSMLTTVDQKQIFLPVPSGKRKIIISTMIAETSITIDDVTYVIDCGKTKMSDYDPQLNTETLKQQWVSRANAEQRKGRAGRVKPGVCYHLYTKGRYLALEQFPKPEILRLRLDRTILTLKILQLGEVSTFFKCLMDPPDPQTVLSSLSSLKQLNAIDDDENLTPLGYHLARLPIAPQMGKMLLFGTIFSCLDPILSIATALDYKDPFQIPMGKERLADKIKIDLAEGSMSDHILIHLVLRRFGHESNPRKFCYDNFLSYQKLDLLQNMKKDFMRHLYELNFVNDVNPKNLGNNQNSYNLSLVKAVICASLYPNVASIKTARNGRCVALYSIGNNRRMSFHPKSVLSSVKYFDSSLVVYHTAVKSTCEFIHDATLINSLPLVFFADHFNRSQESKQQIITIAHHIKFTTTESTAILINDLKNRMNWFLEYKISNPGPVSWTEQSNEVDILRAIMELITIEDLGDFSINDTEEDDDIIETIEIEDESDMDDINPF